MRFETICMYLPTMNFQHIFYFLLLRKGNMSAKCMEKIWAYNAKSTRASLYEAKTVGTTLLCLKTVQLALDWLANYPLRSNEYIHLTWYSQVKVLETSDKSNFSSVSLLTLKWKMMCFSNFFITKMLSKTKLFSTLSKWRTIIQY